MTDKPQLYTGQSLVLVERSRANLAEWALREIVGVLRDDDAEDCPAFAIAEATLNELGR